MIENLYIKNFVIFKEVNCEFISGFNVISGETGAGKSILIDALSILFGSRMDKKLIGSFDEISIIEGSFTIENQDLTKLLREQGFDLEEGRIIVTRQWSEKTSTNRINGRIVTAGFIKEVMNGLIDIHGQNQNQLLMNKKNYFSLVDNYRLEKTQPIKSKLKDYIEKLKDLQNKLSSLNMDGAEIDREVDILEFQINEIEELGLENLVEKDLDQEYNKLANIEKIQSEVSNIYNLLNGYNEQGNILSMLGEISQNLSAISPFDEELKDYNDQVYESLVVLQEVSASIHRFYENLYFDEERFEIIEETIYKLTNLKRKYGKNINDILEFKEELSLRLDTLKNIESNRNKLLKRIKHVHEIASEEAQKLTLTRKESSQEIEKRVTENLKDLNMTNANFNIKIDQVENLSDNGYDTIDFMLKTNKGQEAQSLSKIASGGEVSRIMLGFKEVFSRVDPIDTIIFDEIDAGISGRTAQIVGEKLVQLSKDFQIISISHLPQIAALADHHILIEKEDVLEKTVSKLTILNPMNRKNEIARLLGGVNITDTTLLQAEEMIRLAKDYKKGEKNDL